MIKLELTEQFVAIIGAALENSPYKVVAPVLAEMQKQIEAQRAQTTKVEVAEAA